MAYQLQVNNVCIAVLVYNNSSHTIGLWIVRGQTGFSQDYVVFGYYTALVINLNLLISCAQRCYKR